MSGNKKRRDSNWSEEEKNILFEILRGKANIIENKKVDSRLNKKKVDAWKEVEAEFKLNGKNRDLKQIKEQWRRMKREARQRVSSERRCLRETGGGSEDEEKPSEIDCLIKELLPHEFEMDTNTFDSQGQVETSNNTDFYTIEAHDDGLIDPFTGEITSAQSTSPKAKEETQKEPTMKRKSKLKSHVMTSYEESSLNVLKEKTNLDMQCAQELHNLRMKYEEQIYKARLEILNLEKTKLIAKLKTDT